VEGWSLDHLIFSLKCLTAFFILSFQTFSEEEKAQDEAKAAEKSGGNPST
jgi:hypothetical protein